MSSKKTSKTTPKQNTKRYIVFNHSEDNSILDSYLGTYSNKSEIEADILDEVDVSGIEYLDVSIYDMHLNCWLHNVTIVPNGISLTWEEP